MNKGLFSLVLMIFVLLMIIPISIASDTVFDGWIPYEGSQEIDGMTFTLYSLSDDLETIMLKSNELGIITLDLDGAYSISNYVFYFNDIKFTLDDEDANLSAIVLGKEEYYEFEIEVEKSTPTVTVSREASNSSMKVFDETEITVSLENTGDITANSVSFSETLPSYFSFEGRPYVTDNLTKTYIETSGRTFSWKGNLYEDEEYNIYYTIKLDEYSGEIFGLEALTIPYTSDGTDYEVSVSELNFTSDKPINVTISVEEEEAEIGDNIRYEVDINNVHTTEEVVIDNLRIYLPSGSEFVFGSVNDIEEKEDHYYWSGELNPLDIQDFDFDLDLMITGTNTMTVEIDYSFEGVDYQESYTEDVTVSAPDINVSIESDKDTYSCGDEINVSFYLGNSDESVTYTNVDVTINSDLSSSLNFLFNLYPLETMLIKKLTDYLPCSDSAQTYNYNLSGVYYSEYDEEFDFSDSLSISVAAADNITKAVGATLSFVETINNNAEINVMLENLTADEFSNVSLIIESGSFKKTMKFSDDQINEFNSIGVVEDNFYYTVSDSSEVIFTVTYQYNIGTSVFIYSSSETVTLDVSIQSIEEEIEEIIEEIVEEQVYEENVSSTISEQIENLTTDKVEENITQEPVVKVTTHSEHTKQKVKYIAIFISIVVVVGVIVQFIITKRKKNRLIRKTIREIRGENVEVEKSAVAKKGVFVMMNVPDPGYDHSKLQEYISYCKGRNMETDKIKKKLIDAGWLEDIVDIYLN